MRRATDKYCRYTVTVTHHDGMEEAYTVITYNYRPAQGIITLRLDDNSALTLHDVSKVTSRPAVVYAA